MRLRTFELGPGRNFTYLVEASEGAEAVVIDPSYGIEPVLRAIDEDRVKVRAILNTHSHPDHVAGNAEVRARTGARTVAHRSAPLGQDRSVEDGDVLEFGRLKLSVHHTPGHTPDSVLYLVEGHLATGDTLFVGDCGRTDLPGGDPSKLFDSLFGTLVHLDDALVVLPGHNYGATPTSTIGREKLTNPVLKPRTREEFLRFLLE